MLYNNYIIVKNKRYYNIIEGAFVLTLYLTIINSQPIFIRQLNNEALDKDPMLFEDITNTTTELETINNSIYFCNFDSNNICGGNLTKNNSQTSLASVQQISIGTYYVSDYSSISNKKY